MMADQYYFSSAALGPIFSCCPGDAVFAPWEAEALTRALQVSISPSSIDPPLSPPFDRPAAAAPAPPPPTGRVAKRKRARASRRSLTTFIAADPANFREMVQQVTGLGFGAAVEIPDPPRSGRRSASAAVEGFLPTLDTSEFLLDRETSAASAPTPPSVEIGDGEDGAIGPCYPTLESWGLF